MDDNAITRQAYSLAYGKCTKLIHNKLDLESVFERVTKEGYAIGLLKKIKQIC